MASRPTSSTTSSSLIPASDGGPTKLPKEEGFDLDKFRASKEAAEIVAWVQSEFSKARTTRSQKQTQWYVNMAMFFGQQWVERSSKQLPAQFRDTLMIPKKPYYRERKVINRVRSFVRWELSKFLSQTPSAVAVPATAEDEDIRAAYAAEQAWNSISSAKNLRNHFARATWWTIITGTGFIKTNWDQNCIDKVSGERGDIKYSSVTPFNLFVPDMREQDIEDQPFVITAYNRTVDWCYYYFADELKGVKLAPSSSQATQVMDEAYLNLSAPKQPDSVTVYETWVKPGATKLLPNGGLIITIDDVLVSISRDGLPYDHGEYPFAKFEHIPSSLFYADSPLVDLNQLNKEYNQIRSEISEAGRRMAKPQLISPKGAIVVSRLTNEPGQVIEYNPGFAPPQPMPLAPLPQYYLDQQGRILQDWEDISGEKEVTRGQAPAGVTAGTAINYLQEAANQFHTAQYQSIEQGYEKIAGQTIGLFVQYVDLPRKIKTVGADGSFDTLLLAGSDIASGTDIRIEKDSAIGKSRAANEAKVMDMFAVGLIDQPMALKMMEVNGFQKMQDLLNVAEKKAQRENTKMKAFKVPDLRKAAEEHAVKVQQALAQERPELLEDPMVMEELENLDPPVMIPVDDFDVHEVHIDTHNKFRMSQEYESLAPEVREQFDLHVEQHLALQQQAMMEQAMQAQLAQVTPGMPGEQPGLTPEGQESPEMGAPGATVAANGAVPEQAPISGGI